MRKISIFVLTLAFIPTVLNAKNSAEYDHMLDTFLVFRDCLFKEAIKMFIFTDEKFDDVYDSAKEACPNQYDNLTRATGLLKDDNGRLFTQDNIDIMLNTIERKAKTQLRIIESDAKKAKIQNNIK